VDCEYRKSVTYDQQNLYGFKRLGNLFNASARYSFSKKIRAVELELFLEVLNVFNYQPVLDYQFDGEGFHEIKPFGITPIFGLKLQL
jgi:outer membrane receptor protein involved in Fe transport